MSDFVMSFLRAVTVILLASFVMALVLTSRPSTPALLSTAEYAIDTEAAIRDRADARAHAEALAALEAAEAADTNQWRTLQIFGLGGLAVFGALLLATIRGATEIRIARLLAEKEERRLEEIMRGTQIVEGRAYPARPEYRKELEG